MIKLLLLLFIILYIHYYYKIIETLPNEKQYFYCSDKRGHQGSHYQVIRNHIEPDKKGFYSDLLRIVNKDDKQSKFFRTPICKKTIDYDKKYFNDNKIIDYWGNSFVPEFDPLYENNDPYHIDEGIEYQSI